MSQAIIGVTIYNGQNKNGTPISAVQSAYIAAIRYAGGIPVLLPNQLADVDWDGLLAVLDGVLFTGGGDIRPGLFNVPDHPSVGEVDNERDAFELPLLRALTRYSKPFLGICRGCQVMNVALGGTLFTHIPDQLVGAIGHDYYPDYPRNHLAHSVRVAVNSSLANIVRQGALQVNSLHHQGVDEVAPGLIPVAYSPDGLVEALELPGHPFGLSVQWHPEWLMDYEHAQRLFNDFVSVATACKVG